LPAATSEIAQVSIGPLKSNGVCPSVSLLQQVIEHFALRLLARGSTLSCFHELDGDSLPRRRRARVCRQRADDGDQMTHRRPLKMKANRAVNTWNTLGRLQVDVEERCNGEAKRSLGDIKSLLNATTGGQSRHRAPQNGMKRIQVAVKRVANALGAESLQELGARTVWDTHIGQPLTVDLPCRGNTLKGNLSLSAIGGGRRRKDHRSQLFA